VADVAVISVISSGVVGVLGAVGGFYAQRVTLANERAKRLEARRDDLRGVLDDAAKVGTLLSSFIASPDLEPSEGLRHSLRSIETMHSAADEHLARLGVRVGPDDAAFLSYYAFTRALNDLRPTVVRGLEFLDAASSKLENVDLTDYFAASEELTAGFAPLAEDYSKGAHAASAAFISFLKAANELAGVGRQRSGEGG
jgi:hypothetical protein